MRPRVHIVARSVLAAAAIAASCGGPVTSLDGAVGAVPIFSPASFKERATSHTSDQIGAPDKFSTYTWYLETEASPAAVEAFYSQRWPGAGRVEDDEEGATTLRNPPLPENENTPLGESVSVTIKKAPEGGKTQFSITEDVFSHRRP